MQIECPKCFKQNRIELEKIIKCGNCHEELTLYKFKKPIMSGGAILAIGVFGSQLAEYTVFDNRYPMSVEYSIIDACSNSYEEIVSNSIFIKRKNICLCAMEKTMNDISYIRYKVDKDGFASSFDKNSDICLGQKN